VGDVLTIESATGQIARYKVGTIRILLPEQVVAAVGDPECRGALHLLTCYPFRYFGAAPKRFLVTALPVK
jgi:LPXTG-site transpeptidase (sortase) family protein